MTIDSYRFLDFATRQVIKAWAARQEAGAVPFTPLVKPLRLAGISYPASRPLGRPHDPDGQRVTEEPHRFRFFAAASPWKHQKAEHHPEHREDRPLATSPSAYMLERRNWILSEMGSLHEKADML